MSPAGKKEILARRIGRDEIAAIYVCGALAESQAQYFSQKHGGVKQYAQKFISEAGQQNGLYWQSAQALLAARSDHWSRSHRRKPRSRRTKPNPSMVTISGSWKIKVLMRRAAPNLMSSMER